MKRQVILKSIAAFTLMVYFCADPVYALAPEYNISQAKKSVFTRFKESLNAKVSHVYQTVSRSEEAVEVVRPGRQVEPAQQLDPRIGAVLDKAAVACREAERQYRLGNLVVASRSLGRMRKQLAQLTLSDEVTLGDMSHPLWERLTLLEGVYDAGGIHAAFLHNLELGWVRSLTATWLDADWELLGVALSYVDVESLGEDDLTAYTFFVTELSKQQEGYVSSDERNPDQPGTGVLAAVRDWRRQLRAWIFRSGIVVGALGLMSAQPFEQTSWGELVMTMLGVNVGLVIGGWIISRVHRWFQNRTFWGDSLVHALNDTGMRESVYTREDVSQMIRQLVRFQELGDTEEFQKYLEVVNKHEHLLTAEELQTVRKIEFRAIFPEESSADTKYTDDQYLRVYDQLMKDAANEQENARFSEAREHLDELITRLREMQDGDDLDALREHVAAAMMYERVMNSVERHFVFKLNARLQRQGKMRQAHTELGEEAFIHFETTAFLNTHTRYRILGVDQKATWQEIIDAYLDHPQKNDHAVRRAFALLSTEALREEYDRQGDAWFHLPDAPDLAVYESFLFHEPMSLDDLVAEAMDPRAEVADSPRIEARSRRDVSPTSHISSAMQLLQAS